MKRILICALSLVLLVLSFCACTKIASSEKVDERLSKLGYNVIIDYDGIPAMIQAKCGTNCKLLVATKPENNGMINAFYFNSKKDATDSLSFIKEWASINYPGQEVRINDKVVYLGSDQGLKDFK